MATKILLGVNNTPRGIIKAGNDYSFSPYIVNPANDELKWKYINETHFNGQDARELVKQQPALANIVRASNKAIFTIQKDKYPNESTRTLLAKNYAIVWRDNDPMNYQLYFIKGRVDRNPKVIFYEAFRDTPMEYTPKETFDTNMNVNIERAHTPDVKDGLWNISMEDSQNIYAEKFDDFDENSFYPEKIEEQEVDYREDIISGDVELCNLALNQGNYLFQFVPSWYSTGVTAQLHNNYALWWTNLSKQAKAGRITNVLYWYFDQFNFKYMLTGTFEDEKISVGYVNQIINIYPLYRHTKNTPYFFSLQEITNSEFKPYEFKGSFGVDQVKQLKATLPLLPKGTGKYSLVDFEGRKAIQSESFGYPVNQIEIRGWDSNSDGDSASWPGVTYYADVIAYQQPNGFINEFQEYSLNTANYNTDLNAGFVEDNIAKIHSNPYEKWSLKTVNTTQKYIIQQLVKNKISISYKYSGAIDNSHIIYKINDKDNPAGIYETDYKYGQWLDDQENWQLPLLNDPFNNYLNENRYQLQQRTRIYEQEKAMAVIGMAVGSIGASAVAGLGFGMGSLAGTLIGAGGTRSAASSMVGGSSEYLNAENKIQLQKSMIQDKMGSSRDLKSKGDDVIGVLGTTSILPLMVKEVLFKPLKRQVARLFHQFGVNLMGQSYKIQDYIDSKYYFNYVQTQSIKQNIILPISDNEKDRMDDLYQNGVWIIQLRDWATFKGIKNWEVNNIDYGGN